MTTTTVDTDTWVMREPESQEYYVVNFFTQVPGADFVIHKSDCHHIKRVQAGLGFQTVPEMIEPIGPILVGILWSGGNLAHAFCQHCVIKRAH